MDINNHIIEKEQDQSTHKEQSSDPLLHYLEGYPAKKQHFGHVDPQMITNSPWIAQRTSSDTFQCTQFEIANAVLSQSYKDNSIAKFLHSRSIILQVLYLKQTMLLSGVLLFSNDFLTWIC